MFNYLGRVVGKVLQPTVQPDFLNSTTTSEELSSPSTSSFNLQLYRVDIPALSSVNLVTATVLSFPGFPVVYEPGDIVLIGELEEKSPNGFTYVILGSLQKQESTPRVVPTLLVDNLEMHSGKLYTAIDIYKSEGANNPQQVTSLNALCNTVHELATTNKN